MVSRREKLKLSQSKAQEQIFNLHVKLVNQELSAGNKETNVTVVSILCKTYAHVHLFYSLLPLFRSVKVSIKKCFCRSSGVLTSGKLALPAATQDNPETQNAQSVTGQQQNEH